MDRRTKATLNREKAIRLKEAWGVSASQVRYSDDGHWYAVLHRFPAALFDAHGYVMFTTAEEYRSSPHIRVGKQISVPKPGISAIPGYVRVLESEPAVTVDVDIHSIAATEGHRRLVQHLDRERNQTLVRKKKKHAASLDCEVCGFSFGRIYDRIASDYCEVHQLSPLSEVEQPTQTRMEDLAILCANCHRVVHLRNPPYTLDEVRRMLTTRTQTESNQGAAGDPGHGAVPMDRGPDEPSAPGT
jgi:5-methylcytosine-specific restriction endonuclease McrA